MNEHTLKILQFDKIISLLESKCATELGKDLSSEVKPITNLDLIKIYLNEVDEMKSILDREGSLPFRQIYNVKHILTTSKLGQVLSGIDLYKIGLTLKNITNLFNFILGQNTIFLNRKIGHIEDFSSLIGIIERSIDFDGKILDTASGSLSSIRREIKNNENRIKDKINQIANSPKYKPYLSDPIVTTRNGRYCIPVKSEYKSQVPGIVHDSSGSGLTLFVEPGLIVDMGNKLKDLYGKEKDEEYKVLSNLSELVGDKGEEAIFALEISAYIDIVYAKACLAYDLKASKPRFNEKGKVNLVEARHPILYLQNPECVPINIHLGFKFNCLLITGPNTGGKTVTLKTLGLICIMAMCGMFVPCESDSEISIFKEIFTDIGDEQSIEQSLSTFSAHMKNIVSICEEVNKNSLVLLDELGAGTDPTEGAALARGIIEHLMNKECKIVATTHYGELKNFAFVNDNIENASVEFDTESLRPTYKLLIGIPGSSNAFHIAKRMGISEDIISIAQKAQDKEKNAGQEIIDKIEAIHQEAGIDRIEAAKRLKEIEEIKAKYNEDLKRLQYRESVIEDKIKKRANKIIKAYSNKIGETLEALKNTETENQERQDLKRTLNNLVEGFEFDIKKPMKSPEKQQEELPSLSSVSVGDRVYVKFLEQEGVVEEYKGDNKIIVMVGSMKMTMSLDKLAKAPQKKEEKEHNINHITMNKIKTFKSELNIIGMRAEEAILILDKYLDDAVASNAECFRVVHGKGSGALRSAVHLFLKENHYVKSYELCGHGEGGDGATKVYLN